jgi:serine/threonine protein kinase
VDALAKYCLPTRDVRQALYDVAEALRFLHSKGIAHLNVNAENVLVKIDQRSRRLEGSAKLGDWNFAEKAGDGVCSA